MRHKNIAVLMTALDSEAQTETLKGIEQYGKDCGYNIAVFLWFTGAFEKEKHNAGEINIIDLPDLHLFDGVILFSDALHLKNNREKIADKLKDLTCPVVCIGMKFGNAYYVGTDGYSAMKALVEHYIVDHKMSKIHFVKGVEGNGNAEERYRAYVDALTEHDIPIVPDRITQGDFYVDGGELAAKEILNSSLPFPEAIVCANDIMAITVCDILIEKGYHVPGDVVISGYDYSVEGQNHYPRLTTIRSRSFELGEKSCQILIDAINGKNPDKEVLLPDEIVYDESCGCQDKSTFDEETRRKMMYGADIARRNMIHQMLMLDKSIMEGDTFHDWIVSLKEFIEQINPTEFYCCINEEFEEHVFELDLIEQESMDIDERLGYSEKVKAAIAYQNGVFKTRKPFLSKYAFDDLFQDTEQCKMYLFSPLHYLERNFGYFVFVDSEFPMDNQLYISWLINMGDSIENMRKQCMLQNAMYRLDEMYIRDSLTNTYNRFGMERFFAEIKQKCRMSKGVMQLSFVDVDNLKKINDAYGHEAGDGIIYAAATVLQEEATKSYVIRYGGDEFIVMGRINNPDEIENYWKRVQRRIKEYNASVNNGAELSMSYGYEIFKIDAKTTLEDCIKVADQKMYIDKKKKKKKNKKD